MVNIIVKNKRFFQLSSLTFVVFTLSACGGGGGSSSSPAVNDGVVGDTPDTKSEISAITESNYVALATNALSQVLTPSTEPAPVNGETALSSQSLNSAGVTAVECESGSGTDKVFFQKPIGLSDGDYYSSTYNNCKNNTPGGGYLLTDGNIKVDYKISGDYLAGGIGTYGADMLYGKYEIESKFGSTPAFSVVFDGDLVYDAERTAVSNRWKQESKKLLVETKDAGVVTWSALYTDSTREWIDNIPEGTYALTGKTGIVLGSHSWFWFDVEMSTNVTGFLEPNGERNQPEEGVVIMKDNTSPAIVTITLNGNTALVECDLDGDMIPEFTKTVNVEDLPV